MSGFPRQFTRFKNKQIVLLGCALLLSLSATILSIVGTAYLIANNTTVIPGWQETNCTVTQVVVTNSTLTPACDCLKVNIWATDPLCLDPALMEVGLLTNCIWTPGCVEEHFYVNQVLSCYINPNCATFETTKHPSSTKSNQYDAYIIVLIISSVGFVAISLYAIYQIIKEYRYVQIMELERLINL